MADNKTPDKDEHTGTDTTGHEWDGIKELNTPLPRWWLWIFYATIIWSVGYMVLYPAWPTLSGEGERGGTKGTLEWTQYKKLEAEQQEILARRAGYLERFHDASFSEIKDDPELYAFSMAGGISAFKDNCATCHGTGGAGAKGYPNLNDDDWIWGGDVASIYQTIKYGIRMHEDAHQSMMPAYDDMLSDEEIESVSGYVSAMDAVAVADGSAGAAIFAQHCAACHGTDGRGMTEFGAPNLADAIWLKSEDGSVAAIASQLRNPKHGMMPAFIDRLDDDTIRQLSVYVHSLGGGE
jgi:cytochrome c oxidase cbb3-type subunit 3